MWGQEGLGCALGAGIERVGALCALGLSLECGSPSQHLELGEGGERGSEWDQVAVMLPKVGSWVCWVEGGWEEGGVFLSPSSCS